MQNENTYPIVDRSKIDFSNYDERNIGYAEGELSDGRPYRLECWAVDQITNLTIFVSSIGIEHYSSTNVLDYIEAEGLYWKLTNTFYGSALLWNDTNGNEFWSANLVVGDEDETYIDSIPLKPWDCKTRT